MSIRPKTTLLLFLIWAGFLLGQIHDPALKSGDYFLNAGEYNNAVTEYRRYLFFNPSSELHSYAYYKMSIAFRSQHRWDKAIEAMRHSILTASSDSAADERKIDYAVILLVKGENRKAEIKLLQIESNTELISIKKRAVFLRGVVLLKEYKFEQAQNVFRSYLTMDSSSGNEDIFNAVDSMLSEVIKMNYKSPRFAKYLSTFMPGAGQVYSGNSFDGINAFIINGLTGYLTVSSIIAGNIGNAMLSYFFLFNRYYFGNRNNAEELARKHNEEINRTAFDSLIVFLMYNDRKLEPNSNRLTK